MNQTKPCGGENEKIMLMINTDCLQFVISLNVVVLRDIFADRFNWYLKLFEKGFIWFMIN